MKFLIEFNMGGEEYSEVIYAESWEDAEKRLTAIKYNGRLIGKNVVEIPLPKSQFFQHILNSILRLLNK